MFEDIKNQLSKFEELDENELLKVALDDSTVQAQIIDRNQHQLYDEGIQADNTPTGNYAPITVAYYKPLAASEGRDGRSDHITGKDTGETYNSMRVLNGSDGFVIAAEDRNDFFSREPEGLGLTNESIEYITPQIADLVNERISQQTGF